MVKILMAGILAVCGYFLWQYYFAAPKLEPPIDRLLLFMDGHVNEILGPLPSGEKGELSPPAYTQELRALREDIKNMQATAPAGEGRRYAATTKATAFSLNSRSYRHANLLVLVSIFFCLSSPKPLTAISKKDHWKQEGLKVPAKARKKRRSGHLANESRWRRAP